MNWYPIYNLAETPTQRTLRLVAEKVAILSKGRTLADRKRLAPKMAEQCQMPAIDAVTWQAAMILTGIRPLLSTGNPKLAKATAKATGHVNVGLTLSPAREASPFIDGHNACPGATEACTFACVGAETGQGALPSSKIARTGRTIVHVLFPEAFNRILDAALAKHSRGAAKKGARLAFRFNVASDHWKAAGKAAQRNPGVLFYDYSVVPNAVCAIDGVDRVYSRKDGRTAKTLEMLRAGYGVAVVFAVSARSKGPLPKTWNGFPVIDGDLDDLWTLRKPASDGFVVGLRVKGNTAQIAQCVESDFAVAA